MTYHEMLSAEGWTASDKQEIEVPVVQSLTFKVCHGKVAINPFIDQKSNANGIYYK